MLFFLSTPEYNKIQLNTTKVRVHLRTGIAEILDQHQDLIGQVDNNIVEIETSFENRIEKNLFIIQNGVFVVSNKGLDAKNEYKGASVYVYGSCVREITPTTTVEDFSKQYEQKNSELLVELGKAENVRSEGSTKVVLKPTTLLRLLQEETEFFRKALVLLKELRSLK